MDGPRFVKRRIRPDSQKNMKCYTLSEKDVKPGVPLEGMPVDGTLKNVTTAKDLKVILVFRERDGIVPDELLEEDLGRASACGRVILSASNEPSKGRFLVWYDPRVWYIDASCGDSGAVLYRSRKGFLAVARGESFRMRRLEGKGVVGVVKGKPAIVEEATELKPPDPNDGWFLATME